MIDLDLNANTKKYLTALTIAGFDPSGGAGIVADLKTFHQQKVFGLSAITAVTIQNSFGVSAVVPTEVSVLEKQLLSLLNDYEISAVKIGQIATSENLEIITQVLINKLKKNHWVVWDPVLISSSGRPLLDPKAFKQLSSFIDKLHQKTNFIMTPNLDEFKMIKEILNQSDLNYQNYQWILTGGQFCHDNNDMTKDVLTRPGFIDIEFTSPLVNTSNHHGTGCIYSAHLCASLAAGNSLEKSCQLSKDFIFKALLAGKNYQMGAGGYGPVNFWI